ncbi:MAG: tetratricopeptide repeat protein [Bacteroidetes bacterium]|nr:tetratricopeptide repeat protein [Bacteroidota bacterium]
MGKVFTALLIFASSWVFGSSPLAKMDSIYTHARQLVMAQTDSTNAIAANELTHVIKLAKELKHPTRLANAYQMLSYALESNYPDSSLQFLWLAQHLYDSLGDENIVYVERDLGFRYLNRGNFEKALDAYQYLLNYSEQKKNALDIAFAYSDIGYVYDRMGNYKQALKYHLKANGIIEDTLRTGIFYGQIGITYDELGLYDSAIYYNQKAIALFQKNADTTSIQLWKSNLGNTYIKLGKWNEALTQLTEAKELSPEHTPFLLLNLGKVLMELGRMNEAKTELLKGKEGAIKQGLVDAMTEAEFKLYEWFTKTGEDATASTHLKRHYALKDSIYSLEKLNEADELQLKYETEKRELENKNIKAQRALDAVKLNRLQATIAFVIVAAILVLVTIALFYNNQRLKAHKLKNELALNQKNAQLELQNKVYQERLRISKDLHDNIGSKLTLLQGMFQQGEHEAKTQMASLSNELTSDLRETVWALNQDHFTVEEIYFRAMDFIDRCKRSYPEIEFKTDFSEQAELTLEPAKAVAIYRIVQESLNNALKHANASTISFSLTTNTTMVKGIISDNGKGFDPHKLERQNGLINLKTRAKECGGELFINSEVEKGTQIEFTIPNTP